MSDIFDNEFEASTQDDIINKALEAGYGTDAAAYTGGRALQREDLEATLTTVLDVKQSDLKVFHKLNKQNVSSTVHQINRLTGVGDDEFLFVGEGEKASEGDAEIQRKQFMTKYLSSKWQVAHQLTMTDNTDNPLNEQKIAAVMRVSRAAERGIFHGNSAVVGTQFDGFLKTIEDSAAQGSDVEDRLKATVRDIRGLQIAESSNTLGIDAGEELFDEIAETVYNKGGDLSEAYFPPVLASQFKALYSDRLRLTTKDSQFAMDKLPDIVTAVNSTIKITDDCGADKMFKVKGRIIAAGDATKRPNAPSSVTAEAASSSTSQFTDGFAGNYNYAVHAINAYGISAGTAVSGATAVSVGQKVTLTITPDSNGARPTGYIITRSNAGGTELMEMVRIPANGSSAKTYVDENADLPGTASVVLLTTTTEELRPNVSFGSLMPISNFDLPTDSSLAHRGVVALYGMLEVRAAEHCALIKNIGYKNGLY